jgi:hypothetical protein
MTISKQINHQWKGKTTCWTNFSAIMNINDLTVTMMGRFHHPMAETSEKPDRQSEFSRMLA